MSNPRSSRRTSARIATFHVDDEIEISSSLLQNDSLDDRVSGAGPPALSLQSDADLTEVPDSFVHDEYLIYWCNWKYSDHLPVNLLITYLPI